MVSPENIYANNIIQTEHISLRNICAYACAYTCTYGHVTTINENRGHEFGREQRVIDIRDGLELQKTKRE